MKNYLFIASLAILLAASKIAFAAPFYLPVGPQQSIPVATVTNGGWEECYSDTYNNILDEGVVLASCTGSNLMLACRPTGSTTLQLLAQAPRADALFNTPNATPHTANGSAWYFGTSSAWGFMPSGDVGSGVPCDIGNANGPSRLCWHTQGSGGYRCGANQGLNGNNSFERVVYQPSSPAAYVPVGPQQNVPVATVTNNGWSECHRSLYNENTDLATIQANCPGANLMLACSPTGGSTLQLLAQAPRADVLFDVGSGVTASHHANGSEWYYSSNRSWGFAPGGAAVNRNGCDFEGDNPDQRLCWHTSGGNVSSGYRCGSDIDLFNTTFERIIYQSNTVSNPGDCNSDGIINTLDVTCTINKALAP